MKEIFIKSIKDHYNENKYPYKMTIGEYHIMVKNFEKRKSRDDKSTYIVFLGDVEENSYKISFDKNTYSKISRDDLNKYTELTGEEINNIYRFKKRKK
jgi:hypothetical protein